MIKAYSKDLPYSYIEGFFPTFELIQHKRESLKCVYVSQDALLSDGYKKLVNLLPSDMIITSDKAFSIAKTKENAHVLGVFSKFEDHLDPNQDQPERYGKSRQCDENTLSLWMSRFGFD